MIDIQDLIETTFHAKIEHLESKFHALTLRSAIGFESTCNINTRQLQILLDNCDLISSKIKDYLANNR